MRSFVVLVVSLATITGLNAWPSVTTDTDANKICKSCTSLVTFFDKLNSNDSHLLENALIRMCNDYSSLPGKQTTQTCTHITKDLLKLFQNVNKNTFCDDISACNSNSNGIAMETTVTDDPTCNFCVTVVTNVKDIISGGPTELEVKWFVEDACHYLGSFENECVSLSDEYIDQIFSYIRQSLDPKKFCKSIGACNATTKAVQSVERIPDVSDVINIFPAQMPLTPLQNAKPVEKGSDDMECLICKRVVKYVIQQLSDNRTEEEIISALQNVCSLLPQKDRTKCDAFIEQYTNELIHILIEEGDPDLACTLLGVCVPKSVWQALHTHETESVESTDTNNTGSIKWTEVEVENTSNEAKVDKTNKNKLCFECELLMHFIQNEIYDYKNEEQIENFIKNQVCQRMQIVITKEACDHFIQQYGPQVLQLIAQKLFDPSDVCQKELHLCGNSSITIASKQTQPDFQVNGPTEKCELCVSLVQQIDSLLQNEQFDKQVAKVVEKSCNVLPRERRVECELMVEAFAPYFLQMVGHLSDANEICRSIDMCYSSGGLHLLGGHKCTFGPTYWCHTIAHAEACKATHFCKNKVWKPIA